MNSTIRIVLVSPSHPGNIGAVARAMKTMELTNLYLVTPKKFPHVDATARAAGADDVLEHAVITNSLTEAIKDCQVIFGTSARPRVLSLPRLNPKQAAQIINEIKPPNQIAIVFGRENNGLSNEELELCNYQIYIPTNPNFYSLNLAAAVQLITYEIKMVKQLELATESTMLDFATSEAIQSFHQHLKETLTAIGFLKPKSPKRVLTKLKLLFNRTQLEKNEVNILRGILTSIQTKLKIKPKKMK